MNWLDLSLKWTKWRNNNNKAREIESCRKQGKDRGAKKIEHIQKMRNTNDLCPFRLLDFYVTTFDFLRFFLTYTRPRLRRSAAAGGLTTATRRRCPTPGTTWSSRAPPTTTSATSNTTHTTSTTSSRTQPTRHKSKPRTNSAGVSGQSRSGLKPQSTESRVSSTTWSRVGPVEFPVDLHMWPLVGHQDEKRDDHFLGSNIF